MTRKAVILISIILLAVSCRQQASSSRSTTELVREILSDRDNPYREMIPLSPDPKGEICLVGTARSCAMLAERFAACDSRENVDGSHRSDGLPDFAGETISSIILPENIDLQDGVVRSVLASLDTSYHVSPYDLEGIGRRMAAKVIVLADVCTAENGKFDVDTMFSALSCGIPAVSPFELMLSEVLDGRDHSADIGVIHSADASDSLSYPAVASMYARKNGVPECRCTTMAAPDSVNVLMAFFDRYLEAGETKPLDAIFIDNARVDMDAMYEALSYITDLSRPESMKYGRLLSPGFRILESGDVTCEECFNLLRKGNCFTHKVSFPRCVSFMTTPNPGLDGGNFVLIPIIDVQN